MKKIILATVLMISAISGFAQNARSIYDKYSDENGVSAVYISPAMFRLIGRIPEINLSDGEVDIAPIVKSLNGMYILNVTDSKVAANLTSEVNGLIKKGTYELLMEAKDNGETMKMYTVTRDGMVNSFVMLVDEGSESTFICFEGKIAQKDLDRLLSGVAN